MSTQSHSHFEPHSHALGRNGRFTLGHRSRGLTSATVHSHLDGARGPCERRAPRGEVLELRPGRGGSAPYRDLDWGWNGTVSCWLNAAAITGAIVAASVLPRLAG